MAKNCRFRRWLRFCWRPTGKRVFPFPSVAGEGHNPTFRSQECANTNSGMILKIAIGNNLYFFGKAAIRHSTLDYRSSVYWYHRQDLELLFLTALSLFYNNKSREFKVVTGLPVDRMHLAEELEGRLLGENHQKYPFRRGVIQDTKTFYISEVEIVPQPLGTYWSQFLDGDKEGTT